ncbi:MAG TPA: DNA mismatch repair protein MutS [Syntrophobacteraceae bacterium]|nr:DNA mismatch repair protein MutS [Syntrophobacteraceae bacterium]
MTRITPMMQQYLEIKAQHPDALLLYRMGDFYELFLEDAVTASRVLEITLTSRDRHVQDPIPMCGVPYHSADGYVARLVAAGHRVAICDQVEDPRHAKGLVRRAVTRVITPGLIVEPGNLDAKQPNYLAAVNQRGSRYGLAYLDVSTGEFRVVDLDGAEALHDELLLVSPRELLLSEDDDLPFPGGQLPWRELAVTRVDSVDFDQTRAVERLCQHFQVKSLDGFGVQAANSAVSAAGAILSYARANHLGSCQHVTRLLPYSRAEYMALDEATLRNLEIFGSASFTGRKGSLLDIVDRTQTAMGGRMFQQWLRYPLLDLRSIQFRQQAVAELVTQDIRRRQICQRFSHMHDILRLNSRIHVGNATPRDLYALRKSLELLPSLHNELLPFNSHRLAALRDRWDMLADVTDQIAQTLVDDPPLSLAAGGVIRGGVDAELDRFVRLSRDAKGWMTQYEAEERQRTGINSLKVRYNKVFGYFVEVSNANLAAVPSDYVRKQTLVNAERFITEQLKIFETQVLEAEDKRQELEERLFHQLRLALAAEARRLQAMAEVLAEIDCLAGLAEVAATYDYCCPQLDTGGALRIQDGRHPVIEHFLEHGTFVPNDLDMDNESRQVLIITGPNMAGKSTILRQVALIVLLAQIGSFVPASEARLGLVDRIFTRVGAADDLARGRSTFMVEMQETAAILHQATPRSLVILDEIGRGTSTFDGLSIAWAVAEHLHDLQGVGVKTLFATHYHELTELARSFPRVHNLNVAIKEWQNEIIFFHKLVPGGTNKSYGIQVARLAGIPTEVISRSREILNQLEQKGPNDVAVTTLHPQRRKTRPGKVAGLQLSLFQSPLEVLRERLLALDLDRITPMAALQTLYALQQQVGGATKKGKAPPTTAEGATSSGAEEDDGIAES